MEVEREFKRNFIRLSDQQFDKFILDVAQRQRFNSTDDFYAAIGYGGISLNKMMPHIKDEYVKEFKQPEPVEGRYQDNEALAEEAHKEPGRRSY